MSPKPEPLVCKCQNGGICQEDTSCKCAENFSGRYCENEVRRVPTADGASSPAAVIVPLLLVVIVILTAVGLYIYCRNKQT